MRAEVILALASLADAQYHSPAWFSSQVPDGFDAVVHTLYDDMAGFPDPSTRSGSVLVPGEELRRLSALAAALTPIVDEYDGRDATSIVADPRWKEVVNLAGSSLTQMLRNGGWGWPSSAN